MAFMHSSTDRASINPNPFLARVTHEVEGKLAVTEGFHPSKLRLERGREGVRAWAGVGRDEVEVIPVPLRPDVGDVVELRLSGGGWTCLGFNTFSIKSLAFVSTSALSEAVTEALFFAGRIFHGSLGFAIVVSPFVVAASGGAARLQHLLQRLRVGQSVILSDLDQSRRWQPAVADQFLGVAERDHVVGP